MTSEKQEDDAECVWLLIGREYRISRSILLQWFFKHLNTFVGPNQSEELVGTSQEFEVLSVLPQIEDTTLKVVPTTKLSFIGSEYRFVFCLDISPSLSNMDTETGNVLMDDLFENLKNALFGLVQPFCIPGCAGVFKPRLHLTVLAHTYINVKECQVLMQGYCVNTHNVKFLLCQLRRKLQVLENLVAEDLLARTERSSKTGKIKPSETSLFYMIRDSLLALQLLPDNASAGIVVVTDGVFNLENAFVTDALLAQVRATTAVCSFLQVGTGYRRAAVGFGYVPHCALMELIAKATSGAYLLKCPAVRKTKDYEMNIYHKSLFCWHFQRGSVTSNKVDQLTTMTALVMEPPQTQQTMRYMEFDLQTKLSNVLIVRLREGYIIEGIRLTKDNAQIEVMLVWPWKEHVNIEYIAKAVWPFESKYLTHVIVNVSGPYEFLVDITNNKQRNHRPLRKAVLQRFEQTMKSLEASDILLVQIQLFAIHPYASYIPDAMAQGSAIFFMPINSNVPVLTLQHGSKMKKSPEGQFANFWKPIVTMDTKIWSKWMHCHRLSILLQHDRPISKELFTASSAGSYVSVHCRAAITSFNRLLKDWCSFTLLENHSYVKFLMKDGDGKPQYFCVLRLNFKGLCIVFRLAFLAGTTGVERMRVTEDLKEKLCKLEAPINKTCIDSYSLKAKEFPCVIFLTKQFERVLVKYDFIPEEIRSSTQHFNDCHVLNKIPQNERQMKQLLAHEQQRTPGAILSQYLYNQRWVWTMRANKNICLDSKSVSQILEVITNQRLHEGFNFCSSSKGILTLVKEVDVAVDSTEDNMSNCCVIQYIIFPPHHQLLVRSHDDSVESNVITETEGDIQLVIEVWLEPQHGTMDIPNCSLDYIHGIQYNEIPKKIFAVDAQIVREISSYMGLHSSCLNSIIALPIPETTNPTIPDDTFQTSSMLKVPFLFSILCLLKKSRLLLTIYPMMKAVPQDHLVSEYIDANSILMNQFHKTLKNMCDYEVTLNCMSDVIGYVKERSSHNNMSIWSTEKNAPIIKAPCNEVKLKCCLKSFGSRIMIFLVPATVEDLDGLVELGEDKDLRRRLPIFIFECEHETLKQVPPVYADFKEDVLQDYSSALSESALTPRHFNQKLPDNRSREVAIVCQAVYDHYFWSLVSSVYQCLQNNYQLDSEDVELSIELVCEESMIEIDITEFIRTICNHYQTSPLFATPIEDIVFPETVDQPPQNKNLLRLQKRSSSGSSSFVSSRTSLKMKTSECENVTLQQEIRSLFVDILQRYFTRVPYNPYFMFFKCQSSNASSPSHQQVRLSSSQSSTSNATDITGDEMDDIFSEMSEDELEQNASSGQIPMFLHLTCSCHYKSSIEGNIMRPISVTTLPTCLAEILVAGDDVITNIDPQSPALQITLDLICLTQPIEPEEGEEWKTPNNVFKRQNSNDTFYSSHSKESGARTRLMTEFSKDDSYLKGPLGNILDTLPATQNLAVQKTIEEIRWLLKDEIASALRARGPVSEESLDIVAKHVSNSQNAENCIFHNHNFKFVTGIEKADSLSLALFIFELESASLGRYLLKRVGKYHCLVVDREESEMGFEEVKERAKTNRRNFGHRRSQSDFTNNRLHFIKLEEQKDNALSMCRSHSVPSVSMTDIYIEDDALKSNQLPLNQWPNSIRYTPHNRDDSQISTATGESVYSLNEARHFIQRSISFTEQSERATIHRRRFSMPDLHAQVEAIKGKHQPKTIQRFEENEIEVFIEDDVLQPSPDFWLFMHISVDSVDVYLHRRRSEHSSNVSHQQSIFENLLESLDRICKIVNQRILLEDLHDKNICHNLLIPEEDDSVWENETEMIADIVIVKESQSNKPFDSVVHANYLFKPGHFKCDMVWENTIPIHKRLHVTKQTGGHSIGLMAVQSVLNKFRISNRKNVFVFKDSSKNVFYFKVKETISSVDLATSMHLDDENLFTPVEMNQQSRTSSFTSLNKIEDTQHRRPAEIFQRQESYTSVQSAVKDKGSVSDMSTPVEQHGVQFCIYGIRDPDPNMKTEMMKMIQKKLDSTTLDLINQSLARNPKCKLTPEDVEFIQVPGELPSRKIQVCLSNAAVRYLHATLFFLHQHLLEQYNTPRFTSPDLNNHFRNYSLSNSSWAAAEPIKPCDVFLYNRREKSVIGIAVIYMNLVDSDGLSVITESYYPRVNYSEMPAFYFHEKLKELLNVKLYEDVTEDDMTLCRNPVIEFSIWSRGNIDIEWIVNNLLDNTRYALCDVFMEYELFCTPLCFVPPDLQSSVQSSRRESMIHHQRSSTQGSASISTTPKPHPDLRKFYSEPTTPSTDARNISKMELKRETKDDSNLVPESCESFTSGTSSAGFSPEDIEKRINVLKPRYSPNVIKKFSRESSPLVHKHSIGSRTSSIQSEHDQDDLKFHILTDAECDESIKTTYEEGSRKNTWQEIEIQRRHDLQKRKNGRKHEHGLLGELHTNFHSCASNIFESMIEEGCDSLYKQEGFLNHQYVMETVMHELFNETKKICPDIHPKIFERCERTGSDGQTTIFYPRYTERTGVESGDRNESSMDIFKMRTSLIPGHCSKYIVIGRNSHKWLQSMGTDQTELSDDEEGTTPQEDHCKQKFRSLCSPFLNNSSDRRKFMEHHPPSCIQHAFVPRQKFFMAVFEYKKVILYTYNFSVDINIALCKQLKRLYAWNNVRTHLNTCLFMQKLGLFHHKYFLRDCPDKADVDVAAFASSSERSHIIPLAKEVSPKLKERSKAAYENTLPPDLKPPLFDEIFRDRCPVKPLHQSPYVSTKDLVKRQAYQYMEVWKLKLHATYQQCRLQDVYNAWKHEGPHVPITEDNLRLLKKNSRFVHFCGAPIMFQIYGDSQKNDADGCDGMRSPSLDEKDWYEELKWSLVQKYIQYLQTLGLCVVHLSSKSFMKTKSSSSGRVTRSSIRSSDGNTAGGVSPEERPTSYYLQKTTVGGIILTEVYLRNAQLCYSLLAFESVSLRGIRQMVSVKDERNFHEDCSKFKDLTHVHSFVYDFHIRNCQLHLAGRHSVFHKSYPVHKLMDIILQEYPKPPRFSRCILNDGVVSLPCTPGLPPLTVFKYLTTNASNYNLSRVDTNSDEEDNLLVYKYTTEQLPVQFAECWRTRRDTTEYDGFVAVYINDTAVDGVLTVPFFLLLANKKEFYPRPHLLSSVSSLRHRTTSSAVFFETVDNAKQKGRVRFTTENDGHMQQVQSTGSIKRTSSWTQNLCDGAKDSMHSSGSENALTSLSTRHVSVSPNANISPENQHSDSADSDISDVSMRSTSSTQETVLKNEFRFVEQEMQRAHKKLNQLIATCLSNCWRDVAWYELLTTETLAEEEGRKIRRGRANFSLTPSIERWRNENMLTDITEAADVGVNYSSVRMLLQLVSRFSIPTVDSRISNAFESPTMQHCLLRTLMSKYDAMCRMYVSEEDKSTFMCILNPANLDMFFIAECNEVNTEFSVVYRHKPRLSPFEDSAEENLTHQEKIERAHIENVITCLCYNLVHQLFLNS